MNVVLWVIAGLLAVAFLGAGLTKLLANEWAASNVQVTFRSSSYTK